MSIPAIPKHQGVRRRFWDGANCTPRMPDSSVTNGVTLPVVGSTIPRSLRLTVRQAASGFAPPCQAIGDRMKLKKLLLSSLSRRTGSGSITEASRGKALSPAEFFHRIPRRGRLGSLVALRHAWHTTRSTRADRAGQRSRSCGMGHPRSALEMFTPICSFGHTCNRRLGSLREGRNSLTPTRGLIAVYLDRPRPEREGLLQRHLRCLPALAS